MNAVKTILYLTAMFQWHLEQIDVNNAFLHGDLTGEVYMQLPQGYNPTNVVLPSNPVC